MEALDHNITIMTSKSCTVIDSTLNHELYHSGKVMQSSGGPPPLNLCIVIEDDLEKLPGDRLQLEEHDWAEVHTSMIGLYWAVQAQAHCRCQFQLCNSMRSERL